MDGNGGCCIDNWGKGGHVAANYDTSKTMDTIMQKFRPIAPKPFPPNVKAGPTSSAIDLLPCASRHAKASGRGRKKTATTTTTTNNNNNKGRKRKSKSPNDQTAEIVGDHQDDEDDEGAGGVTLLPLFPEAPDLSNKQLDSREIAPGFDVNYGYCHWN